MGYEGVEYRRGLYEDLVGLLSAHCYAERLAKRMRRDFSKVELQPQRLEEPLRWRKPQTVFVCSRSDLFHEDVPDEFIEQVFATMILARRWGHVFQVLTKRPERMCHLLANEDFTGLVDYTVGDLDPFDEADGWEPLEPWQWPLPNVWLGVSVENDANRWRLDYLCDTPAAVRFVSAEPLLGPLGLKPYLPGFTIRHEYPKPPRAFPRKGLDWVIVGGESGGPPERRLVERCFYHAGRAYRAEDADCERCHRTGWEPKPRVLLRVRDIRDQCQAAGVAFFFKQWGGPSPKAGGALLDGREWQEMPRQEVRA